MDYAPNPSAHIPLPTDHILYPPPPSSIPHHPFDTSLPHNNAPPLTAQQPPHAPLYHYTTTTPSPPPPQYSYHSTVISRYGNAPPTPVENPPLPMPMPLTDPTHYVAPPRELYYGDVVQQPAPMPMPMPSQGYDFSSASYYRKYGSHYGPPGYDPFPDPYETHAGPPGSVYSLSKYSYQQTAYQSGGYDPNGYPQVANGVSTHYPQYPTAKAEPSSQTRRPYPPKHKKPKTKPSKHCCVLCKIGCSTAEDLEVHKQGKKHQRNLEKLQLQGTTTSIIGPQPQKADDLPKSPSQKTEDLPKSPSQKTEDLPKSPSQLKERKRKSMPTGPCSLEELELKKKRVHNAGAPAGMVRVCGVCNIVVNSQKVFELHCAGSKHAMMLKKLQEDS